MAENLCSVESMRKYKEEKNSDNSVTLPRTLGTFHQVNRNHDFFKYLSIFKSIFLPFNDKIKKEKL